MKNLAVFCSGFGSNLQAIINAVKAGRLKAKIALVVSDNIDAFALVRAKKAGIPILHVDPADFKDRGSFDYCVRRHLQEKNIDFIVLAGFMRILGPQFVRHYKNRIVNIHPSLLPSFKGSHAIRDAWQAGVKVTGVTVHFVTEDLDGGPIILQEPLKILVQDSGESLEKRTHRLEHKLYPRAIDLLVRGKLVVSENKVTAKG